MMLPDFVSNSITYMLRAASTIGVIGGVFLVVLFKYQNNILYIPDPAPSQVLDCSIKSLHFFLFFISDKILKIRCPSLLHRIHRAVDHPMNILSTQGNISQAAGKVKELNILEILFLTRKLGSQQLMEKRYMSGCFFTRILSDIRL